MLHIENRCPVAITGHLPNTITNGTFNTIAINQYHTLNHTPNVRHSGDHTACIQQPTVHQRLSLAHQYHCYHIRYTHTVVSSQSASCYPFSPSLQRFESFNHLALRTKTNITSRCGTKHSVLITVHS